MSAFANFATLGKNDLSVRLRPSKLPFKTPLYVCHSIPSRIKEEKSTYYFLLSVRSFQATLLTPL